MAYSFDSNIGGATTNSYATLIELDDYLDSFLFTEDMQDLPDSQKQRLLTMAWRVLDTLIYSGSRATTTQSAEFPRTGLYGIDSSTIPTALKHAQIELAYFLLSSDSRYVNELKDYGDITSYEAGSLKIAFTPADFTEKLPTRVTDLLKKLGVSVWKRKFANRRFGL